MFANHRKCCHSALIVGAFLLLSAVAQGQTILRVDGQSGSATPAGQGNGWGSNAYLYLRDAIARANTLLNGGSPPSSVQIWVRGNTSSGITYRTDENAANPSGSNSRTDAFVLRDKVDIYGQFNTGATSLNDRSPIYLTILSGEINTGAITDNAYHVVTASNSAITDTNCRLEGFTIRDGHSTIPPDNTSVEGGGIHISNGASPRIDRCKITANYAVTGAGVFVKGSDPVITNCVIQDNDGFDVEIGFPPEGVFCAGGGLFVVNDSTNDAEVTVITTQILSNWVPGNGGGVMCQCNNVDREARVKLINCLVAENHVQKTAGLDASGLGGGILIHGAGESGAIGELINCTIVDNDAWRGGGIYVRFSGTTDDSFLKNSIVWGNEVIEQGKEIFIKDSELQATNNDVRNRLDSDYVSGDTAVTWVSGNIGETLPMHDPNFVDAGSGDYRLTCKSMAVDHGSNALVPCDQYNVDNDAFTCGGSAEATPDLDLSTRLVNTTVDMGAFEKAIETCTGDTDGNCKVDVDDLVSVILQWGNNCPPAGPLCPADVSPPCGSGSVDVDDLIAVILGWGTCTGCTNTGEGAGVDPESYADCQELCMEYDGEQWIACMQSCLWYLCNEKQIPEYCEE